MFLVPPNAGRGERCGFLCVQSPLWLGGFSFGAFPLLSSGERLSPRANCYPQAARKGCACTIDVFGSGRGTSTLNLQSELW